MACERPAAPILSLTPRLATARRVALVWGVHAVVTHEVADVDETTRSACEFARRESFAAAGAVIVIVASLPFGTAGTTDLLRIATV